MLKQCKQCGGSYEKKYKQSKTQWSNSKYCSYKCSADSKHIKAMNRLLNMNKNCKYCKQAFTKAQKLSPAQWKNKKFCSRKCSSESKRKYASRKEMETALNRAKGMSVRGSAEHLAKISKKTSEAMQRPDVQEKIRQPRGALSLEHRMKLSDVHAGKMPKNMMYASNTMYPNIKRGYYDINGTTMYFRSKWEANYALYLDFLIDHKEIYKWEFEPDTFMFEAIKLGTRSYTPDFKVFVTEDKFEYHEVKGYMDSKSKTKLKRFAKYYPEHTLILVDTAEYNLLKKQIGAICKFY